MARKWWGWCVLDLCKCECLLRLIKLTLKYFNICLRIDWIKCRMNYILCMKIFKILHNCAIHILKSSHKDTFTSSDGSIKVLNVWWWRHKSYMFSIQKLVASDIEFAMTIVQCELTRREIKLTALNVAWPTLDRLRIFKKGKEKLVRYRWTNQYMHS